MSEYGPWTPVLELSILIDSLSLSLWRRRRPSGRDPLSQSAGPEKGPALKRHETQVGGDERQGLCGRI